MLRDSCSPVNDMQELEIEMEPTKVTRNSAKLIPDGWTDAAQLPIVPAARIKAIAVGHLLIARIR